MTRYAQAYTIVFTGGRPGLFNALSSLRSSGMHSRRPGMGGLGEVGELSHFGDPMPTRRSLRSEPLRYGHQSAVIDKIHYACAHRMTMKKEDWLCIQHRFAICSF
jgi:hypothetical protein